MFEVGCMHTAQLTKSIMNIANYVKLTYSIEETKAMQKMEESNFAIPKELLKNYLSIWQLMHWISCNRNVKSK